jgi:EAL domain-containing protein (putative c-di-GMP-specific phosphodiesterase class I)/ActR/RegA family two-component response regulator
MQLIVLDDDEAIADYLASVAVACGWRVHPVMREDVFQSLVTASPPDAIMLDLQLAGSDGVEQLEFLRANRYRGAIVLMSGFDARVLASARRIGDSLGLNIVGALEKPAGPGQVREILARIAQAPGIGTQSAAEPRPPAAAISADDVATAIEAGRMELHLQPIVAADGHWVNRAEALIRWRDPARGLVGPDQFIPVAEQDSDVIDRLTMWVAETGVAHYQRLAALGSGIQICINISGRNLCSQDFPDRMAGLLERHSVPQGALGLEITESVAMHDLDATASVLTRLRLKGFPVAIDDFGTGHSSFTALRRMPFSAIKIDKSFVGELETSEDSLTIVRSVIQLARDMHLTSVAEGVGSADAARRLTELGIDGLQGYYFSEPLPFNGFASWLKDWPEAGIAPGH